MKFRNLAAMLLLCTIVLASSASADWVQQVGGIASSSINGGTAGLANGEANYALTDDGHKLSEALEVVADVANGNKGSASAAWDTQGEQGFKQLFKDEFDEGNGFVSTSLNGVISVNVAKTSTDGIAHADAGMHAESGAQEDDHVFAKTSLEANLALTGAGSALAAVEGATAKADSEIIPDPLNEDTVNYATSQVAGDIKLTASNKDDSTLAKLGGVASGSARIASKTYANFDGSKSKTTEHMDLHANRGYSFTGMSYADGYLNGQEMAESVWNFADDAVSTTDLESASQINGMVLALNIRDRADMEANLKPWAHAEADNNVAEAGVNLGEYAQVTRDTVYAGKVKAQAEGYIPVANWQATAAITDPCFENRLAFVSGEQGLAWNGVPDQNPGFGVGAWILNPYNRPQTAAVGVKQFASTEGDGKAIAAFQLYLNGMKTITGTSDDAVGAFGAIANQMVSVKNVGEGDDLSDFAPTIKDVNAINWLEGKDANPLPGAGKYSPSDMEIDFDPTDAIQRTAILSYDQGWNPE